MIRRAASTSVSTLLEILGLRRMNQCGSGLGWVSTLLEILALRVCSHSARPQRPQFVSTLLEILGDITPLHYAAMEGHAVSTLLEILAW